MHFSGSTYRCRNLPIKTLRYGFLFQLSDNQVEAEQEDVWWNKLQHAGASQKLTDNDIPINTPMFIQDSMHWNHPEFLRAVSVGRGYLYFMAYIIYSDKNGLHQAEYCGAFHWQPSDTLGCHHHNRE